MLTPNRGIRGQGRMHVLETLQGNTASDVCMHLRLHGPRRSRPCHVLLVAHGHHTRHGVGRTCPFLRDRLQGMEDSQVRLRAVLLAAEVRSCVAGTQLSGRVPCSDVKGKQEAVINSPSRPYIKDPAGSRLPVRTPCVLTGRKWSSRVSYQGCLCLELNYPSHTAHKLEACMQTSVLPGPGLGW